MGGLTMFMKEWKVKATPSGRRFCQLAVSASPTDEIDFGLWATPNTMDYMALRSLEAMQRQFNTTRKGRTAPANLREQVIPAMWPTPTTSDYKGSSTKVIRMDGKDRTFQRLDYATEQGLSGLNVQMARQGRLNPAFPCWLMGYPVAWLFSAPHAAAQPRRKNRTGIAGKPRSKALETP